MSCHKIINLLYIYNQISRARINTYIDTFSVLVDNGNTVNVAILTHFMPLSGIVGDIDKVSIVIDKVLRIVYAKITIDIEKCIVEVGYMVRD